MSERVFLAILVGSCLLAALLGTALAAWLGSRRAPPERKRRKIRRAIEIAGPPVALAVVALAALAAADVPFPVLVLVTAANLRLGEEFPFSPFPMYAKLGNRSTIVRITDEEDRVVALGRAPRLLTKVYAAERRGGSPRDAAALDEARRRAGRRALDFLVERSRLADGPCLPSRIRLWEVELELREGRIEERCSLVAERDV